MKIIYFKTQKELHSWLLKNHNKASELFIGFYKKGTGRKSITYPEALDEALCFGWIDGVRKSLDEESYMIRYTPRKKGSIWSAVNINRINELIKKDAVHESGFKTFTERDIKRQKIYSYENKAKNLSKEFEDLFRRNKKAWGNFIKMAPSYKRTVSYWVMNAVKDETKLRRLKELIEVSAKGDKPFVYTLKPKKYLFFFGFHKFTYFPS
jgi:uncharacterized protein YdeI (YjbR/CyaY-like superfamily)